MGLKSCLYFPKLIIKNFHKEENINIISLINAEQLEQVFKGKPAAVFYYIALF